MDYPGRVIRLGETDGAVVRAVADRLKQRGYAVTSPPGVFDAGLKSLVRMFQAQHNDLEGRPLKVDGEIGPITWGALFGRPAGGTTAATGTPGAASALAGEALRVAITQIGVMESPLGSNRGPQVDQYLIKAGVSPGLFWCMAFVYWCFDAAAANLGVANSFPRTAGCLDAWNRSPNMRFGAQTARADPSRIRPGAVFILDFGGGAGHTGFVQANTGGLLTTVEGNSNNDGSRNGLGVFRLQRRNVMDGSLKGFIQVP